MKIQYAINTFEDIFGVPEWRPKDPLDELMVTILSQNTNDLNRDNAYHRLREMYPTWEDVMGADVEDISLSIHPHPTLTETFANAAEMFAGTITDLYSPK